jgi:hypothetical protein
MGGEVGYLKGGDKVESNLLTATVAKMGCMKYAKVHLHSTWNDKMGNLLKPKATIIKSV